MGRGWRKDARCGPCARPRGCPGNHRVTGRGKVRILLSQLTHSSAAGVVTLLNSVDAHPSERAMQHLEIAYELLVILIGLAALAISFSWMLRTARGRSAQLLRGVCALHGCPAHRTRREIPCPECCRLFGAVLVPHQGAAPVVRCCRRRGNDPLPAGGLPRQGQAAVGHRLRPADGRRRGACGLSHRGGAGCRQQNHPYRPGRCDRHGRVPGLVHLLDRPRLGLAGPRLENGPAHLHPRAPDLRHHRLPGEHPELHAHAGRLPNRASRRQAASWSAPSPTRCTGSS